LPKRLTWRFGLGLLVAVATAGAVFLSLHPREPIYQGKRLSTWIEKLAAEQDEGESLSDVFHRQEMLTNTVLTIGPEAVPCAVRWIRERPRPSWYDEFQFRVEHALRARVRLPERKDRSWEALWIFQILGPAAKQAIPDLARLLNDEYLCGDAARCLGAIGPDSVPALSNALATGTNQVRRMAAEALAELGPSASATAPLLLQTIRAAPAAASFALRALVEVETNSATLLPLLVERFADSNTAPAAAYALARLGTPGLPFLLQGLTNHQPTIRAAAGAALDPGFQRRATGEEPSDFYARSGRFECVWINKMISEAMAARSNTFPNFKPQDITPILAKYAQHTNAAVRSAATQVIEHLDKRTSP
jgi:HEAT repeat protein